MSAQHSIPNLLVCGFQKCGTTSLHYYLGQIPRVHMSRVKELNFFNLNYDRGFQWYLSNFSPRIEDIIVGESSPNYIISQHAIDRIAYHLPAARIVLILRNPVDRAYSNYWFNICRGVQDPEIDFLSALKCPEGRSRYISKGLYAKHLVYLLARVPREHVSVFAYDQFAADPLNVLTTIARPYGVHVPETFKPLSLYNQTVVPKSLGRMRLLYHFEALKTGISDRLWPTAQAVLRRRVRPAVSAVRKRILSGGRPYEPMPTITRMEAAQFFRSDLAELENLLDQSFDMWDPIRDQEVS